MPDNKTDHKVNFKFLTKDDYMRESALRAGSENCHTNYHYSKRQAKKWDNQKRYMTKRKPDNIVSKDNSVIIYILCISLTKLKL